MKEKLNKPKRFGELLDTTFQLCKSRFSHFFLIMLVIVGPIYLLQALLLSLTGTSFFSENKSGKDAVSQFVSNFDQTVDTSVGEDLIDIFSGLPSLVLTPVAFAAVLIAVNRVKKDQPFTPKAVMKVAFSRFWQILASSLLLALIVFGMSFVSIMIFIFFGIFGAIISPVIGWIILIIPVIGIGLVVAYFLTRWSLFLGITVFDGEVPGIGRSWKLTRGYMWKMLGVFLVFFLISVCISLGIESIFLPLLGESVVFDIILSLVRLFTSTIFAVGYAVVYLDIKLRHEGEDIRELIEDYELENSKS